MPGASTTSTAIMAMAFCREIFGWQPSEAVDTAPRSPFNAKKAA
jgi:hypothetical protein